MFLLSLAIASLSAHAANGEDFCRNFEVRPLVSKSVGGKLELRFSLVNNSKEKVTFLEQNLPWTDFFLDASITDLRCLTKGEKLEPVVLVGGAPLVIHDLAPGRAIEGALPLGSKYSNLEELTKKCSVALVWSYQPEPLDHHECRRVSGVISMFADGTWTQSNDSIATPMQINQASGPGG